MKPAWDQLGDVFNAGASSSVLIADVDCTDDAAQPVCEQYGIQGYPTIKYFVDGDKEGKDYQQGRDFDSLEAFVHEVLEVKCNVADPVDCSEREAGYLEKMKVKSSEERKKQIDRLSKMSGESMKTDLKQWLLQRLRILTALEKTAADGEL
jgi:protein disulfide-isomerase A6